MSPDTGCVLWMVTSVLVQFCAWMTILKLPFTGISSYSLMYRETILSLFLARVEYLFAFPFFSIRFAKTHWEEGEAKIIFFKIFEGGKDEGFDCFTYDWL